MKINGINLSRYRHLALLLLVAFCSFGCAKKQVPSTASGREVLWEQRSVSLFRNKPHILPAKGKVILTQEELLFTPTPYYWVLHLHGRDTTAIRLNDITELQEKKWLLIYPFRVDVITEDGTQYPFVTWRRKKLIQETQRAKE